MISNNCLYDKLEYNILLTCVKNWNGNLAATAKYLVGYFFEQLVFFRKIKNKNKS